MQRRPDAYAYTDSKSDADSNANSKSDADSNTWSLYTDADDHGDTTGRSGPV